MNAIERFLRELDRAYVPEKPRKQSLHVLGSAALMLQAQYERGTKDSDVLQTQALPPDVRQKLLRLAGKDSPLHQRHRLYLDVVAEGLPFLPQVPRWQAAASLNAELRQLELLVLDLVDVIVSKLKRFSANDRADISAMVDMDLVDHAQLVARFRAAVDYQQHSAKADDLPTYVRHLHVVERDMLLVAPSDIELPHWI